ncbi:hypothetical protein Tco_0445214 [Tanacetum coccineum]
MLGAEEARQDSNIMTGMDWLSANKAEIICHEKVVRIPLLEGNVLRVLGEKPEEKMRQLMSARAKEKKQEEIIGSSVRLSELTYRICVLCGKIEFRIEINPGAMPVARVPMSFGTF